eukprot:TRINITY_DN2925_c2_g1_i1.p1 TRINITY_DN2925_c2_g1~~TRINITY_DN2925_c2_g1_i1.p1  ORF type:complete len:1268 (+),score=208.17 TRINITY_DN2925_c2_g1_i1:120-3806(+)
MTRCRVGVASLVLSWLVVSELIVLAVTQPLPPPPGPVDGPISPTGPNAPPDGPISPTGPNVPPPTVPSGPISPPDGPLSPTGPSVPPNGPISPPTGPVSPTGPNVPPDGPISPPNGPITPTVPNGPISPTGPNVPPNGPISPTEPNTPPNGPISPTGPNVPPNGPISPPNGPVSPTVPGVSPPNGPISPPNGPISPTGPNVPPDGPISPPNGPISPPNGPISPTGPNVPPDGPISPTVPNGPPDGPISPTVPSVPPDNGPTSPTVPIVPPDGPTSPTVPIVPPDGPISPPVPNGPPDGPISPTVPSVPSIPSTSPPVPFVPPVTPPVPIGQPPSNQNPATPPPVFRTPEPGWTRQPIAPGNVPAPTFSGGSQMCSGDGNRCETSDGEVGECWQSVCHPLCQDEPGMNCGQYVGKCDQYPSSITDKCCKTCSYATSSNDCSNDKIGEGCIIDHKQGICTAFGCTVSQTSCGGQVCTAPTCHSPICLSNTCDVTKLPDGTNCGGEYECSDGRCLLPGGGAVGETCVTSSDCSAITESCRDNVCHYGRCVASFVSNSAMRSCGSTNEGVCVDGVCEGATSECMNQPDSTPCSDGKCVGGYCKSSYCPEGSNCVTEYNEGGVCRSGYCEPTGPCTRYDMCSGCQSVKHTDQVSWTSLRLPCVYDNYHYMCYGDSGPCRSEPPSSSNNVPQPIWGGTNSVYGTPPTPNSQLSTGVQWRVRRSLLSSIEADAGFCIDNNATSECASKAGKNQWLQFELGMVLPVGVIKIRNSPSWCGQRMVCGEKCGNVTCSANPGFEIRVGTQPCVAGSECKVNPVCATYTDNTGESPITTVTCNSGSGTAADRKGEVQQSQEVYGNYMQVVLVDTDSPNENRKLNMAEGEVFAPDGWTAQRAQEAGYGGEVGANEAVVTEPPYVQSSFKPPTQSSTDKSSIIVVILMGVSLFFCLCVAAYLRYVRKERTWFIRSVMFAAGILRVFDWVSDILFFLFLSAIEDLGEVNNYSIACMIIIGCNLAVECMRLGWAILGRFEHEPFFWTGSLVVLIFQIPGFLFCEPSRLSTYTYDSRMRDRWDWLTHLSEDVPQIILAIIYGVMRSFSATSILTLSVSCAALFGSAVLKVRRKYMRMEFTERALEMTAMKGNSDCRIRAPHPSGMPILDWIPPRRKLSPGDVSVDESYSYSPEKEFTTDDTYDYSESYTYESSLPPPHKALYPNSDYEFKTHQQPSQSMYPDSAGF